MEKKVYTKNCPYCNNDYETENSRQVYCSGTCKTYASQERRGLREKIIPEELSNSEEGRGIDWGKIEALLLEQEKGKKKESILEMELNRLLKAKTRSERLGLEKELKTITNNLENSFGFREATINRWKEQKELLAKNIEALKLQYSNEHNRKKEIYIQLNKLKIARFRIQCEAYSVGLESFHNQGVVKADELQKYQRIKTYYPFDKLNAKADFLHPLGSPPRPFICSIFGETGGGKTLVSFRMADFLAKHFGSKILYVVDLEHWKNDVTGKAQSMTKNPNVHIKFVEKVREITEGLKKEDYEFLFIDSINSFGIQFQYLRQLQRQFPYLSIFPISRLPIKNIQDATQIVLEVRKLSGIVIKGGHDYYCNEDRLVIPAHDDFDPWSPEEEEAEYEEEWETESEEIIPVESHTDQMELFGFLGTMMQDQMKRNQEMFNKMLGDD